MKEIHKYYHDIVNFENLPTVTQKEVVSAFCSDAFINNYLYNHYILDLVDRVDEKDCFDLFSNWIENYKYENEMCAYGIVGNIVKKVKDKDLLDSAKSSIRKRVNSKLLQRSLLFFSELNDDEEEAGLRALSGVKYTPIEVYNRRYTPSLKVVEKLPPVLRLNVLETLSNDRHLSYNIFKNLGDKESFRKLLFGSVLRHRDRVNDLVQRYDEIVGLGIMSTITIKSECRRCGPYEIAITSGRIKTERGFRKIEIFRSINGFWCPLCGMINKDSKSVLLDSEGNELPNYGK